MSIYSIFLSFHGRLYLILILLRILFAFLGTGYIHPDEYFQNGEIMAGAVLHWHNLRTWEWDPVFPCRSIVPPFLTTGLPLLFINWLCPITSPRVVVMVERLSFLMLSFILDYSVLHLVPVARSKALLLLSSSHVLMTFQLRPFSNSLEAILVSMCLIQLSILSASGFKGNSHRNDAFCVAAGWLAAIMVLGIMTRVTFLAFTFPIILQVILQLLTESHDSQFSPFVWLKSTVKPICIASILLASIVVTDSLYFRGGLDRLVLTPYNNMLYNLSLANLANHGLHPRWLHLVVNLPMIIGPGLLLYGLMSAWRVLNQSKDKSKKNPQFLINRTCVWIIAASMFALSMQPHQEPRFLTPLLVPFVILVSNSGYLETAGRAFWMTWVAGNAALSLVFGLLHQGGIVPSLLHLNGLTSSLDASTSVTVVYWKTYMPPWHLLGVAEQDVLSGHIAVADLAGKPTGEAENFLLSLRAGHDARAVVYLVTPEFAIRSLDSSVARCFNLEQRVYPHLDLDHIPESVEMGWAGGLSLGVYEAHIKCISFS